MDRSGAKEIEEDRDREKERYRDWERLTERQING